MYLQVSSVWNQKTGQRVFLPLKITDTQKRIYQVFDKKFYRTVTPIS